MMICEPFQPALVSGPPQNLDQNRAVFSNLKKIELSCSQSSGYGIKYVLKGTESYILNGRRYKVGAGNYLIVNQRNGFEFVVRSARPVWGICIGLQHRYLHDVYLHLGRDEHWLLDHPFEAAGKMAFEETIASDKEDSFGMFLHRTGMNFNPATLTLPVEDNVFFYELACRFIHERYNIKRSHSLSSNKSSTRHEIISRLQRAVALMNDQCDTPLDVDTLAAAANLSTPHFFRCFRQLFGVTPYQYHLQVRLQKASGLLRQNKDSVTAIAHLCGFADGAAFCKSFKKRYGVSPGKFESR